MKNFTTTYPTEGTSALQPELVRTPSGMIVEFPDCSSTRGAHAASKSGRLQSQIKAARIVGGYALNTEMVQSLRYGTARGAMYECIKPWQAVIAGFTFSAFMFACLSFSL